MIKNVIGCILLFLLIFWHTLISYICIAVYILIVGSLRWRVELVISITDININSTGVKSRTARKNCVRLNVINYVISKKEKKPTIFVNWDVCVKKMYRAMGIHSDLSMDFSPGKCSMQTFSVKPKIRFYMKF